MMQFMMQVTLDIIINVILDEILDLMIEALHDFMSYLNKTFHEVILHIINCI